MSLLRASLRLLPLLALAAACTGKRADPEPSQNPPPISGDGGAGGGTGGAPSNGGNGTGGIGGAPSNGGMGGTPTTGGAPATGGAAGNGGSTGFNQVEDIFPFCGCLVDAQDMGGCSNCVAASGMTCAVQQAGCIGACLTMVADLRACAFEDFACYNGVFATDPDLFDDVVALISCECGACGDPICDGTACGG